MQKVTENKILKNLTYEPEPIDPNFIQESPAKWTTVSEIGITGSDVCTIFHKGYEPLRDMVKRKAGLMPRVEWEGNRFSFSIKRNIKKVIINWMEEYFSLDDVQKDIGWHRHPLYPFMLSKPDGTMLLVSSDEEGNPIADTMGCVVYQKYVINIHMLNNDSIKGENGWLRWSEESKSYENQVPFEVELRARHDAAVFNAAGAFVIGIPIGSDSPDNWYINRIERDAKKESAIINEEWLVWEMIMEKNPPAYYLPAGATMVAKSFLAERRLSQTNKAEVIASTKEIEDALVKLEQINIKRKQLKNKDEELKQAYIAASMPIAAAMTSTEAVIDGIDKKVSYPVRTTTGIPKESLERLKILRPEMYGTLVKEGFIKTSTSQTTLLKISSFSKKKAAREIKQKM